MHRPARTVLIYLIWDEIEEANVTIHDLVVCRVDGGRKEEI